MNAGEILKEPKEGTDKYQTKINAISDRLEEFVRNELAKAQATGDPKKLEKSEKKINLFLEWLVIHTGYVENQDIPLPAVDVYDLTRGEIVLLDLGFNVGKEFGGERPAIVLRNSKPCVDQVLVLPMSTQKPKNVTDPIYIEIPPIPGLTGYQNKESATDPDNGKHWANVLSIKNLSKLRIKYPPEKLTIRTSSILDRISAAVISNIALRKKKNNKPKS